LLAHHQTRQALRNLQRRAEAMAAGDFQHRGHPVGGTRTVENLRLAIDVMGDHIEQAQRTMQGYISALTTAQEAERGRIARELHDDTVQQLIVWAQGVDRLQRVYDRAPNQIPAGLATLRTDITDLIRALRTLIADLRPPALDELGLVPAVELLVHVPTTSAHAVEVRVVGAPRRLDADSELTVFRMIQEAWSNIRRHAQATAADITFTYGRTMLEVTISDNGQGFTPIAPGAAPVGHWGMVGMRERASVVGGTLVVTSTPGTGTVVRLSIPYPGRNNRDPVCGMPVRPSDIGVEDGDGLYRFCSEACRDLFLSQPAHYRSPADPTATPPPGDRAR
jgi:signal transduction histidine kinase/YHS domain-containing protein